MLELKPAPLGVGFFMPKTSEINPMKHQIYKVIYLAFAVVASSVQAQVAIQDGNLTIDREELKRTIAELSNQPTVMLASGDPLWPNPLR